MDFTTHTTACCNKQKTYYLLHFNYILGVPKAPKYRYLGYPKSIISVPVATIPTHRYQKSTFSVLVNTIPPYLAPSGLVPATLDPGTGYQNIKIPSRATPFGLVPSLQSSCPGPPKSSILRPTPRHAVINRKHTICYTLSTF